MDKTVHQRDISFRQVQLLWILSDISSVANHGDRVEIKYKNGDITTIIRDPDPDFKYTDRQVGKDVP